VVVSDVGLLRCVGLRAMLREGRGVDWLRYVWFYLGVHYKRLLWPGNDRAVCWENMNIACEVNLPRH
jgi:hypothetical protein